MTIRNLRNATKHCASRPLSGKPVIELVLVLVDDAGERTRTATLGLDGDALASLSQPQRHALVDGLARGDRFGGDVLDPPIRDATIDALRDVLRARVARPERGDDTTRLFHSDAGRAALASWLAQHGSDDQRARFREHLLPPREAASELRRWLFQSLDRDFVRFEALRPEQVCSRKRARCLPCRGNVEFETRLCETPIVREQFDELERLRRALPADARLELRERLGSCTGCTCRVRRVSARVIREWQGIELVRDYQLSGPVTNSARAPR
jgi:hypothetical protein